MHAYQRAILVSTSILGLTLPCGCGKKPTSPTTPSALKIGIQSTFEYVSYTTTAERFSWPAPRTIQTATTKAIEYGAEHIPANEVWVFKYPYPNSNWAGEYKGNTKIYVSETQIWAWFYQSKGLDVVRRACAATAAHEVGHNFLPGGADAHVTDENDHINVMRYPLAELRPTLRAHWYPIFNLDQRGIIRDRLGYPD
jgi:hypothetical protein